MLSIAPGPPGGLLSTNLYMFALIGWIGGRQCANDIQIGFWRHLWALIIVEVESCYSINMLHWVSSFHFTSPLHKGRKIPIGTMKPRYPQVGFLMVFCHYPGKVKRERQAKGMSEETKIYMRMEGNLPSTTSAYLFSSTANTSKDWFSLAASTSADWFSPTTSNKGQQQRKMRLKKN